MYLLLPTNLVFTVSINSKVPNKFPLIACGEIKKPNLLCVTPYPIASILYVAPGTYPFVGIFDFIQPISLYAFPPWQAVQFFKESPGDPVYPGSVPSFLPKPFEPKDSNKMNPDVMINAVKIIFFIVFFLTITVYIICF